MGRQGRRFDAFRLANSRATIEGSLDPAELPRLEDRIADSGGRVAWTIAGTADLQGRPAISVTIAGSVPLTCQRCLGALEQDVGQSTRLLLARDEAELVRLDDSSDDEVVLANAPRHEASCAPNAE
jgi:uncharacterized protein